MKNGLSIVISLLFISLIAISGCEEEAITTDFSVVLESDVVELVNASSVKQKDRDGIYYEAKLTWLFHNIADRMIDVGIDFQFYDEYDKLIYQESKTIAQMPANYTERFSPVYNSIKLTGTEAQLADHVIIRAYEI